MVFSSFVFLFVFLTLHLLIYALVREPHKNKDAFGKSMTHIMGDQPLERIDNPTLSDGSSCLVIKDSFADSFVPWLVDHYQTVWVADFRYFEGSYKSLIKATT